MTWNNGMLGIGFGMLEKWKNGTMSNGLGRKSLIHFVCFYLRFLYKLKPNIPSFQHSSWKASGLEPCAFNVLMTNSWGS